MLEHDAPPADIAAEIGVDVDKVQRTFHIAAKKIAASNLHASPLVVE